MAELQRDYLGFTSQLRAQYGDLSYARVAFEHAYDVFSPELVRELLVANADGLKRWERGLEVFEQLMGQSVLVTEGEVWQRQRRMLQPGFSPRRVAGYAALMSDAAAKGLDAALPAASPAGQVDMDRLFTGLAMDVILRTLFSSEASEESARAVGAVQVASEFAFREMFHPMTLPDWLPLPGKAAKRRALRTLRDLVDGHIARRRVAGAAEHDDLLGMLLSAREETTGEGLSAQEVRDQCMVTFQAGHETTATALLWWSRLIAGDAEALEGARREVDEVLQGETPSAADMARLPWLTATLKEAMRLYPPVPALMSRRTTREIQLGEWRIPKGALVRVTPWVIQRDGRSFEHPDRFLPQRFAAPDDKAPRGAWLPFGTGPRVCIGQHFAMLEMTVIAAMLLQRYQLGLPQGAPACEPVMHVTLRPRNGVTLNLRRRGPARTERP
ncbi:cytochrome P450 [Piscinibacter gummiphilus]|uniref:Cytochrome P450 n=1 Tax=Piscinibacter gummiphilus TaxID=946333 RepID=A0A1W6LIN2_9BURK|nr:cytochrome P450 [Piscinibacter gummiphilus]